ncbi:PAS domain S-box protein [Pedobacter cryoconitis]|uniref:histidine kinase n=1 Tax=Pedobacter cryoconitis TaxID=188932 RepID=A0A7X0J2G6_9SPHI|nr:PAS domain S-box protein [Pedobacter cryoconitis]MBB6499207.1 PAS domain S-box-containing protein [Pedobacter cryoconitis]
MRFPLDLKNIIAVVPVAMAIVDLEMKFLAVSEKWVATHGHEGIELIEKSYTEVFPHMDEQWWCLLEECLKGKRQQAVKEHRFNRSDGCTSWLRWEARPWLTEEGRIGGLMLYSEDITEKKNISLNEKRFQLFMDYFPGLCWMMDDQNVLKYANKNFLETLNLSEEVLGKKSEEIFGLDIAQSAHANNLEVLRTRQNMEFYQTIRDQQGHLQYFKTYKFPFLDAQGEGNIVGAISFDITKNKQLEEDLYQSDAQFKQAFEHSLIGMALITPEGRWIRANSSLCKILGYTEVELQLLHIQDITHPDDLALSMAYLKDLADGTTENVKVEKRYIHKNGTVIWVVVSVTMLNDSMGNPLHYVSQIEDITKRKEIEEDLYLSEKKYRTIFENVQDVFYQTNQQGLVTEVSPSIEQYSGYLRGQIIGHPVTDFYYYLQDRERIVEILRTEKSVIDFEVRLKTSNEELRYASVNARLIIENGKITGTEGSMRDVTTRKFQENALKALNTELTASNEQKNRLLSIIGHDLRNPISGSLQLLDLTLMGFESTSADELHEYLFMMQQELSHANELLEDLLTWAKSQFNSVSFNPVEVSDIAGLIQKCIQLILPMAQKKGIGISLSVGEGLAVMADRGMLETIIRNLISNAVKFTASGGHILVKAITVGKGVRFSVTDNGQGIPEEKIRELFDKNSNYTTYGTSGEKGTGLGLDLCYDFVLKHGGEITVESEQGVGSTFYFTIPG